MNLRSAKISAPTMPIARANAVTDYIGSSMSMRLAGGRQGFR
jgi:hypothetical protein